MNNATKSTGMLVNDGSFAARPSRVAYVATASQGGASYTCLLHTANAVDAFRGQYEAAGCAVTVREVAS